MNHKGEIKKIKIKKKQLYYDSGSYYRLLKAWSSCIYFFGSMIYGYLSFLICPDFYC